VKVMYKDKTGRWLIRIRSSVCMPVYLSDLVLLPCASFQPSAGSSPLRSILRHSQLCRCSHRHTDTHDRETHTRYLKDTGHRRQAHRTQPGDTHIQNIVVDIEPTACMRVCVHLTALLVCMLCSYLLDTGVTPSGLALTVTFSLTLCISASWYASLSLAHAAAASWKNRNNLTTCSKEARKVQLLA
jgi:hypothetical protein